MIIVIAPSSSYTEEESCIESPQAISMSYIVVTQVWVYVFTCDITRAIPDGLISNNTDVTTMHSCCNHWINLVMQSVDRHVFLLDGLAVCCKPRQGSHEMYRFKEKINLRRVKLVDMQDDSEATGECVQ